METGDGALWERWHLRRDADAFAELVSRHAGMVFGTCRRILGSEEDAADVTQECFVELMGARVSVDASLGPWLHTVASRRACDRIRRDLRRRQREKRYVDERPEAAAPPDDEILRLVDEAIAKLPDPSRTAVVLRFLEGRTHESIAQELGVSESTVRYRVERGVERIRAHLRRRGVSAAVVGLLGMLEGLRAEAAPTLLTIRLGKLALAGVPAAFPAAGVASILGGAIVMKKLVIVVALIVAALAATWWVAAPVASPPVAEVSAQPPATTVESASASVPEPADVPSRVEAPEGPPVEPSPSEGIRVSGRVVDREDRPVEGADVGTKVSVNVPVHVRTKDDGTFDLYLPLATNDLLMQAQKDGYESPLEGPLRLRAEGLPSVVLRLTVPRTALVEGRLVDSANRPVEAQRLWFDRGEGRGVFKPVAVETGPDGQFTVQGLGPGTYGIVPVPGADSGLLTNALATVTLRSGEVMRGLRVVYDGRNGLAIAGRVTNRSGEPVEGAMVYLHNPLNGVGRTDGDGRFRIAGLSRDAGVVTVQHPDYAVGTAKGVAAGTENVAITLGDKGRVSGRVFEAETKRPIPKFEVFMVQGQGIDVPGMRYGNGKRVEDAEGRFTRTTDSDRVCLTVRAQGFAPSSRIVEMKEGETGEVDFPLGNGKEVGGQVVDAGGAPVAGAYLYVGGVPISQDDLAAYFATSDSAGRFVIEDAPADLARIGAYHPDYAPTAVAVEEATRIVLQPASSLEGVVTQNDEPLSGVSLLVTAPNPVGPAGLTRTDARGGYHLKGLAPGLHSVVATEPYEGKRLNKLITLAPGEAQRLDLAFTSGAATVEGRVTCNGQPPAHTMLTIHPGGIGAAEPLTGEVGEDGAYRVEDVPAGQASLHVVGIFDDESGRARTVELNVPEQGSVQQDVDLTPTAAGRITGTLSGVPEGYERGVLVLPGQVEVPTDPGEALREFTGYMNRMAAGGPGKDGVVDIDGLEPGDYTVVAFMHPRTAGAPEGFRMIGVPVTVGADQPAAVSLDLGEP